MFVPRHVNQAFAIRLVNCSEMEMAVRLHMDGLTCFTTAMSGSPRGRNGEPAYSWILVKSKSTVTVPGY